MTLASLAVVVLSPRQFRHTLKCPRAVANKGCFSVGLMADLEGCDQSHSNEKGNVSKSITSGKNLNEICALKYWKICNTGL